MTAWCHGAAGIGLARLRSLEHMDDEELRAEIDVAIETTARDGFGANHALCHGDLGNLELLLQASRVLDRPHLRERAEGIASSILLDLRTSGWRTGVALGVEHPGLMTGLAGIGYGLLRLASPQVVPSLLTLEPPKGRARAS
jgi:lantibiotic modifying enzyme